MARIDPTKWERRLNIQTSAADFEKDDQNHSRYEPTSYAVLERLAESGHVTKENMLVDYGCGKGRVSFFMANAVQCKGVGVEYDEKLHVRAMENLKSYTGKNPGIEFALENAEKYEVGNADRFYFFNPFSVKILRSVLGRIYESYYAAPREMLLFFYYATDEYLTCLMTEEMLAYKGDIDCRDLFFNEDEKERILIFSVGE